MKLEYEQRGKYLLIQANGRLDAVWAEYFTEELLKQIRQGQHYLVIDAAGMEFLSSAGIRALIRVFKELNKVKGSFLIVNATEFVEQTLVMTQFQMWLGKEFPADMPVSGSEVKVKKSGIEDFILDEKAELVLSEQADWVPWQPVNISQIKSVDFSKDMIGLGIGSSSSVSENDKGQFGEFLAAAGNVVYQLPDEQGHPDYLVSENQYVPKMHCIQLLNCNGKMKHLSRFAPTEETSFYPVSELVEVMLKTNNGQPLGFVILGEIEGLVGSYLVQSPGQITEQHEIGFPEIRDWLSFSGERSFPHQQALLVGIAAKAKDFHNKKLLPPIISNPEISAHIHGAVFPYQPLQNGQIDLEITVQKFFNGPPPMAVMHLTDDNRPVVGLGESALVRGACWFSPISNGEVLS